MDLHLKDIADTLAQFAIRGARRKAFAERVLTLTHHPDLAQMDCAAGSSIATTARAVGRAYFDCVVLSFGGVNKCTGFKHSLQVLV